MKNRRAGLALLLVLSFVFGLTGTADAVSGYRVAHTGGIGVRLRNSPSMADVYGYGPGEGAPIEIVCQTWGEGVGARDNHIWDLIDFRGVRKYIPDAYTNTPAPANHYTDGIPRCGASNIVNGIDIGQPQNDPHGWGPCQVQDFNGGPYGWVIVSTAPTGTHLVRNGMLWGWFDNGGAPGGLGCPTSDEYPSGNGARQDFQGGSLEWYPGMDHARLVAAPSQTISERAADIFVSYDGRWGGDICRDSGRSGYWGGSPGGRQYDGQCRAAVNCLLWLASGGRVWAGGQNYAFPGAEQVANPAVNARRGDIIQKGKGIHTAVVLDNLGGGRYRVVDSNWNRQESVSIHEYAPAGADVSFHRYTGAA